MDKGEHYLLAHLVLSVDPAGGGVVAVWTGHGEALNGACWELYGECLEVCIMLVCEGSGACLSIYQ